MAKAVVTGTVRLGVQYGSGGAKVTAEPIYDFSWPCHFLLALSVGQRVNALDGMGDLFLGRSFLLQVFLFSTIFYLVVERGLLFCSSWTRC